MSESHRNIHVPMTAVLLLLLLAGTSVHSQGSPSTVKVSECRPQSVVGEIIFSGCTTIESPEAGQPWCLLPKPNPSDPDVKALCAPESIPARNARVTGVATPAACDAASTPPGATGAVFGCYTTRQIRGQLKCNAGSDGLQPCLRLEGSVARLGATEEEKVFGLSKSTFIGIVVGGACAIVFPLMAWMFCWRKKTVPRRNQVGKNSLGERKLSIATSSEPDSPTISTPANIKQRTSSQYGTNSPMGFADAMSTPVPPIPPTVEGSLGKYMIASTYTPTLDDELVIQPGDIVDIFQEFDDGWCSAVNITRGMTRGVFPMHCVDDERGRIDD